MLSITPKTMIFPRFSSLVTFVPILVIFWSHTLLWRHSTTTSYRRSTKSLNNTTWGLLHHLQFTDLQYLNSNPLKTAPQFWCMLKKNCYYWKYPKTGSTGKSLLNQSKSELIKLGSRKRRLIRVYERAKPAQRRVDSSQELDVLRVGPILFSERTFSNYE